MSRWRSLGFVALAIGALWLTLRVAGQAPNPWHAWEADGCLTYNCYCEPIRQQLVRQTLATESNLGFAGVALAIAAGGWDARRRQHWVAVGALAATAIGSAFYHASLTRLGDWADLMGTYGLAVLFGAFSALRLWPQRGRLIGVGAVGVMALCGLQMAFAREVQQVVFSVLIVTAIGLEMRAPGLGAQRIWLWAGLACFAVGAVVWIGDATGRLPCWPEAPLTWHGLWHLLAAGAAARIFLLFEIGVGRPATPARPTTRAAVASCG